MTKDEMVGWHHGFNRHEFDQAPGADGRQGSLAFCGDAVPGLAESDTTKQLNLLKDVALFHSLFISSIALQKSDVILIFDIQAVRCVLSLFSHSF